MVGSVALQGTTSRLSESIKSQVGQERSHWSVRDKAPGLYDVSKNADNFAALVINEFSMTDEITLVFERPLQ